MMKRIEVAKVCCRNNEVHLVIREHENEPCSRECEVFSVAEVKKVMKEEAAKPLLLLRAE
jgi:hypothetical protein